MSVTFGFYNSVNHDRKYNANDMSRLFNGIINDGVFMSVGESFAVEENNGMTINIKEGRAWFNSTWTNNDGILPLIVPTSEMYLNRIDAVILEVNSNTDVRENAIKILQGTPASIPVKPTMTRSDTVNQYPLSYISVNAGVTAISNADITNVVGTSECPYVNGILETVNVDHLYSGWEGQFNEWLEHLKYELSGDVAGNLQNQIDNKVSFDNRATLEDAIAGINDNKWMSAKQTKRLVDPKTTTDIGGIIYSFKNIENETDGAYLALDGRIVDTNEYPLLSNLYDLETRFANAPGALHTSNIVRNKGCLTICKIGNAIFSISGGSTYDVYRYDLETKVAKGLSANASCIIESNNQAIVGSYSNGGTWIKVFNPDGSLVRTVYLQPETDYTVEYLYKIGNKIIALVRYTSSTYLYYSYDNFQTYGQTSWNTNGTTTSYINRYPGSNWQFRHEIMPPIWEYNGKIYMVLQSSASHETYGNGLTYYLYESLDIGGSFTLKWSKTYFTKVDPGAPDSAWAFQYNGYIYAFGCFTTVVSSTTTLYCKMYKISMDDGSIVASSSSFGSSSVAGYRSGFIKNGYFYTHRIPANLKINLNDLSYETWTPYPNYTTGGEGINNEFGYLTKDGKYYIITGVVNDLRPTYNDISNTALYKDGVIIYNVETHKSVYLHNSMFMSTTTSTNDFSTGCPTDDDDNIYITCGYYSSSTGLSSRNGVIIIPKKLKTLTKISNAYIKVKEVT